MTALTNGLGAKEVVARGDVSRDVEGVVPTVVLNKGP